MSKERYWSPVEIGFFKAQPTQDLTMIIEMEGTVDGLDTSLAGFRNLLTTAAWLLNGYVLLSLFCFGIFRKVLKHCSETVGMFCPCTFWSQRKEETALSGKAIIIVIVLLIP